MRAVAIACVFAGHGANTIAAIRANAYLDLVCGAFAHVGVDVFFVLSGYLITSLLLAERERSGTVDLAAFYGRRIRRIVPAYWTFLAVVGILALGHVVDVPARTWLANVLFLSDYPVAQTVWWTGHAWSLAVEEQFYLVWPLVLFACGARCARWLAIACIVALPLVRVATYVLAPAYRASLSIMLHTRMDVLMVGALVASLRARGPLAERFTSGVVRKTILGCAAVAIVIGALVEARHGGAAYRITIGYTLGALAIAAFLVDALERPDAGLGRVLAAPPLVWLGRMSYGAYLWQQLFLSPRDHTFLGAFPLNVVVAVLVGAASYYVIERRFYRPRSDVASVRTPHVDVREDGLRFERPA